MSESMIVGLIILAVVVGAVIWAYGHIKSFHDKLDALLHRNQAVDAQVTPTTPAVVVNLPTTPAAPAVFAPPVAPPKPVNTAFTGMVSPGVAQTIVFDPSWGASAWQQIYAFYPTGTNFVTPQGVPLDNRGNPVTTGFTQANQGG